MRSTKKIASIKAAGKLLSIGLMLFLLSFLTVGNLFIYSSPFSTSATSAAASEEPDDIDDTDTKPVSSEEEKSSSKNVSSNLTEEYLHTHDIFFHLYITVGSPCRHCVHTHGLGDDHSRLHCPPPDAILL